MVFMGRGWGRGRERKGRRDEWKQRGWKGNGGGGMGKKGKQTAHLGGDTALHE